MNHGNAREGRRAGVFRRGLAGLALVAGLLCLGPGAGSVAWAGPDETPGGSGRTFPWWTRQDIPVPPEALPESERVRLGRLKRGGILEIDNDGMRGAWPPGAKGKPVPAPPPGGGGS